MSFSALIPCYNVGAACLPVIRGSLEHVDLCVVVDDGSVDGTAEQARSFPAAGCVVLRHETNLGKGAALLSGFRYLLKNRPDVEAVVTLDGDGQHDPSLIPLFCNQYREARVDLVYGNRMADPQGMPLHRRMLNRISNRLVSKICGCPVFDSQCGYRLYSRALLLEVTDRLTTVRYELETEMLIQASRSGFRIAPVPVSSIYSSQTTGLSHHNLADVIRIGRLLMKHR